MLRYLRRHALAAVLTASGVLWATSACWAGDTGCCLTVADLQRMAPEQIAALFASADMGRPPVGRGQGKVLFASGQSLPRLKVWLTNATWKGKILSEDGSFTNIWAGGFKAIDSQYFVDNSWVDGRPAIVMDYQPGTPILGNTRDELREVAPGLYIGPYFDRFPCPKVRGYLVLQVTPTP